MPHIYQLNPPPNPFWGFVSDLEDHPFFAGFPNHVRNGPWSTGPGSAPAPAPAPADANAASQPEMSEKARGKQPTVEDPPEVDPSTVKPEAQKTKESDEKERPFCGRGRFARGFGGGDGEGRRGRGDHPCRGGRGRAGWNGPPPFMSGHPFFGRSPWAQQGPPAPTGPEHRGPPGPHHHHPHGPPPHMRGWHRRPSPPHQPHPGFDLGDFLNNLGNKLGIDLSGAAEGLGLTADRFTAGKTNADTNFEPRADIFENKNQYTIHLSLPGAKKSDIGVDYDGEHSVLRVTGVVHRPEVDEQMLSELIVDGRKRETGVFEKAIRLGTKRDPANIDVAGITAKMTDGVLVVKIPKVEKVHTKREVPVSADPVAEGGADYEDEYSEKPVLFDAEEQASIADTEIVDAPKRDGISLIDMNQSEVKEKVKEDSEKTSKTSEAEGEKQKIGKTEQTEQLPAYSAEAVAEEEDWENFSDDSGEGEFVKIDVK